MYISAVRSNHSNFAVTHSGMYRYLATDVSTQKHIEQFGSGIMLIYRTEKVRFLYSFGDIDSVVRRIPRLVFVNCFLCVYRCIVIALLVCMYMYIYIYIYIHIYMYIYIYIYI